MSHSPKNQLSEMFSPANMNLGRMEQREIIYHQSRKAQCLYTWIEQSMKVKVLVTWPCSTLCDPMDCSLPGSCVHGILQARKLEWVAYPFSSSQSRNRTGVSCIVGEFFTRWAIREAPKGDAMSAWTGKWTWAFHMAGKNSTTELPMHQKVVIMKKITKM